MSSITLPITCSITGTTVDVKATPKGNPKLPRGWKWIGGQAVSATAFADRYVLRAITVPVVSPDFHGNPDEMKAAWKILDSQLREAWEKSTEAANWAVRRLWSNDLTRVPGESKCPKMPDIYLYGERSWNGWSQSAGAVLRTIEQTYRRRRFEIVWVGSAGIPNIRYPYPYPIHNASWDLEQRKGGEVVFECRLPSGRVSMRLRTKDKSSRYRLSAIQHLIGNPDLRGEASVFKKKDGSVNVKMVGYFPRRERPAAEGELRVRTDSQSFLVILNTDDEKLLVINGDHIRRKLAGHARGLQRWREDQKAERRHPKRSSRKNAEDMRKSASKMQDRLKSFIDETCAQVVNYATRRNLATIVYNDDEQSYFRGFAWIAFRNKLEAVCHRERVAFEWSSTSQKSGTSREFVTTGGDTQ